MAQSNSAPQASPAAINAMARNLILRGGPVRGTWQPPAVDMLQPLNPILPSSPGPGSVMTFQLKNVGLVKRVFVQIKATITAGATSQQNLTAFGLQNLLSNITFQDLGANTRINTAGWHLVAISTAKRRRIWSAAYTTDTPNGYGNVNNRIMYAPASIAANASTEIDITYEVPFVKNDQDLRGAIFADLTQASMFLQCTLNPGMFVSSTADPTQAVYQSAGSDLASLSGVSVQIYQNYLDQLPRDPQSGLPILPQQDLGTAYLLNTTASGLPVANQDNGTAFINARSYESVSFYYDNNGTLNINGSDLNYVQVQSANFTNITNVNGKMLGLMGRNVIGDDFPKGMYYLDFRHRPIDTNQYGNMTVIINPSSVGGSAAYVGFGWEAFGIIGLVNQGGSLPMGG